jgi:hypothetical protein
MAEGDSVDFAVPPEPEDIKKKIMEAHFQHKGYYKTLIRIEVPSYLWSHWKDKLENLGYKWPEFLKLMKDVGETASWASGKLSWEEFIEKVITSTK